MAAPGQLNSQQLAAMQQQMAAEAAKRGMTPEEFGKMQREQLAADAAKLGLTPEQYINQLRMRALQQHQQKQAQQQQAQAQHQTQQQIPVNPNDPPDPKALAVAKFLRSQNLKTRTCILDGQRKDMFKGINRF
jgi:translocation protein SEC62